MVTIDSTGTTFLEATVAAAAPLVNLRPLEVVEVLVESGLVVLGGAVVPA